MLGDASQPTPSRLLEIEKKLKDLKINCAFSEPQYSGEIISLFGKKYNVPVGVIDPLGSSLELNASFYPNLLKAIGDSINSCRSWCLLRTIFIIEKWANEK